MTHDDFCTNQEADEDPCKICALIKRVRRDERDAIEGDSELDLEDIKDAAYQKGFADGQANSKPAATTTVGIPLGDIKEYIINNLSTYSEQQMSALYKLYVNFGGS